MFRFHKTLDVITLFHKPTIASSARALDILKKVSTSVNEASAEQTTEKNPLRQTQFELSVTEEPPTPDQLKSIMDYMNNGALAGLPGIGQPSDLVLGARDRLHALKRLKDDGESFVRPVVVDWNNGKAVLGTDESAILQLLREEKSSE